MTPPISLRALLEAEAKVNRNDVATEADMIDVVAFGRQARAAARPLCEALQEAIAALEEIRDADPMPYRPTHVAADAALAKIREKVVP